MGYRSEVGFAIAKKPSHIIPDFKAIEPGVFDKVVENEDAIFYYCDHVKWYDNDEDYPLVEAVSNYFDLLDADGRDDEYMFIRLGESDDDMECRGNYWDNPFDFGYVRKLVFTVDEYADSV